MGKKINIIGAGIAGLSAGIFARLNGFDTTIYEMGSKAGGVCSSWDRNDYYVNGSIHWLIGSAPGTDLYDMWRQLGVIENNTFYNHSSFIEYKNIEGADVHFYLDPHQLQQHFLALAPQDKEVIEELLTGMETLANNDFPLDRSLELLNAWDWTKIILNNISPILTMGKYNEISLRDFAAKFKSSVLRIAFENFWSPDMSMTFFLLQYSYAQKGMAGYPIGGSGKFIEKLLNRYLDLNGKLVYHQKITEILIEDDKAKGIKTNDGQSYLADYIISACDGNTVLFQMLNGKYVDEKTRTAYQTLETFPSLLYFSAGINRAFAEVEPSIIGLNIPFENPVQIGNYTHPRASFQIYNFDPTVAPQGKTLVTAMLDTDYEYWLDLYDLGPEIYQAEKEKITQALLQNLEKQLGNILDKVDFVDMATPITYKNWTGNHNGSYEGWLPTPAASKVKLPSHFNGLANFYMAGHWVIPGGGMPPAAYSGRDAIQLVCQQERQHFNTY